DYNYVSDTTTPDGQEVLLPDADKLRALRDSLFAPGGAGDQALLSAEAARVEVLNGAGVNGLARATGDWLGAQGLTITSVGTADRSDYPQTQIIDFTGKPRTAAWLARTFHVLNINDGGGSEANPDSADIQVILGADWQVPTAGNVNH